ncbi:MAG: sulfurtransferase [Chloroflexota bacterium]
MSQFNSPHLVETSWLAENLDDANLVVLDCTVFLTPEGPKSGHDTWAESHIPGSGFADMLGGLSDKESPYSFMMPNPEQFSAVMSSYGISDETRVVLYDAAFSMWAARVWWMLRANGFDNAAVLNGGWKKWQLEERPTSSEVTEQAAGNFVATPRPDLIASKEEVVAASEAGASCLLNALPSKVFNGGHIPQSVNLSAVSMLDRETGAYQSPDALRDAFTQTGAMDRDRVITYCGGGIAASSSAFILTLLGKENVAVYDGSMSQWTTDKMPVVSA